VLNPYIESQEGGGTWQAESLEQELHLAENTFVHDVVPNDTVTGISTVIPLVGISQQSISILSSGYEFDILPDISEVIADVLS
jgi:hypothetical protein